jgi:Tfp pilus assembly protein PilO
MKFIAVLALGLVPLLVYVKLRDGDLQDLRKERATVMSEQEELRIANWELKELTRKYTVKADLADFVEKLYLFADQAGIADHKVVTRDGSMASGIGFGGSRSGKGSKSSGLHRNRLEISLTGNYRNIAAYVRLLQETDSPKRITMLKVQPEQRKLQMKVDLELYSYRNEND